MREEHMAPSLEPEVDYRPPPDEGLPLVLLHDDFLVLDKPAGLLTVPGRGEERRDSLVVRAQVRFPEALVVHRLDMATSGLVVLARGVDAQRALSAAFRSRVVGKRYEAVVHGLLAQDEGEVNLPLATDWPRRPRQMVCHVQGKPSFTRYRVLARDTSLQTTRVALEPITGRSHQLRVHLMAIGHPIVGDPLYAPPSPSGSATEGVRLLLHACWLSLPSTPLGDGMRDTGEAARVNVHSCPPF